MRIISLLCLVSPCALLFAACSNSDNVGVQTESGSAEPPIYESANILAGSQTGGQVTVTTAGGTVVGLANGPSTVVDTNGNVVRTTGDGVGQVGSGDATSPPMLVTTEGVRDPSNPEEGGAKSDSASAARAIEEADIIKLSGDRLYALSSTGGLSIVDVSDVDNLKLLGRHRTTATPFEMYVRDETVLVLYNGYGEYEQNEKDGSWTFYQTSYVVSLNTAEPTAIKQEQKFEIEGYIADSRLIGDTMYVVAFDDGFCYRCGSLSETNVLSLDVRKPDDIVKVDELSFEERQDEFGWQRSLSATDERLYIAGPRYTGDSSPAGSVIAVVDITDQGGAMQQGDSIEVAGQINSRWQMDEYEGVLRVISQPLWWQGGIPAVETFRIESSDELTPLASIPLELPRPENLQTVRFDGPRAYAITFERTDPLFTLDLSDPAAPLQVGELEMPGWIYHMEPRGDRVIGLGFDQGNAQGSLTVSIFDVAELATPTMLTRVNFGGDWAGLAEDQDRIHKSFQVLDAEELMIVPFSGWVYEEGEECGRGTQLSGVQMIDWKGDSLALRGIAKTHGSAKRGLVLDERLLTMSDQRLETFDISNRDEPKSTSAVDLAQRVNQIAVVGETIVRVGSAWLTNAPEATVSTLDELTSFASGVTIELPDNIASNCEGEGWLESVLSGGDNAYFVYRGDFWQEGEGYTEEASVITLDVSDPKKPKLVGDATLDFIPSYGNRTVPGMIDNGAGSVSVGDSIVFAQHGVEHNNLGFITKNDYTLDVVDFSNPDEPKTNRVIMPSTLGSTGLLSSGDIVASSHFTVSPTNANAVRFYLDRLDVSDPSEPELMTSINVPGSLLAYDDESSRALTVDYQYVTLSDVSPQQCYEQEFGAFLTSDPSLVDYENGRGLCHALRFKLHLVELDGDAAVLIDSYDVDKGVQITAAALGSDRVFLGTALGASGYGVGSAQPPMAGAMNPGRGGGISYYSYSFPSGEAKLLVVSGLSEDELVVSAVTLETTADFYGFSGLKAQGTSAVVATGWRGRLSIIDASDAEAPKVQSSVELAGNVHDLDIVSGVAVVAMGEAGVQTLALDSD